MRNFHGEHKKKSYFEGWYFKHQGSGRTVAFIPAFHIDEKGERSASLQVITDDGANISKGQKQLMTIARAMLVNAHMLILDEATSNVDTRTEVQIQQAMRRLMRDKTCFVVAHRLSTIKNADLILVVRGGNVVESGTHRELMVKGGFYREMYDAQFH